MQRFEIGDCLQR